MFTHSYTYMYLQLPDYYSDCAEYVGWCTVQFKDGKPKQGACANTCQCYLGYATRTNRMTCSDLIAESNGVAFGAKVCLAYIYIYIYYGCVFIQVVACFLSCTFVILFSFFDMFHTHTHTLYTHTEIYTYVYVLLI
jgi:hypothetical protein